MRLIDADELLKILDERFGPEENIEYLVRSDIVNAQTVDKKIMDIFDVYRALTDYENIEIHIDPAYTTGFIVERYGAIDEDDYDSDTFVLKRDIPIAALANEDSLHKFLRDFDTQWDIMQASVWHRK